MVELSIKIDMAQSFKKFTKNPGPILKNYIEIATGRVFKHLKKAMKENPKTPKKTGEMINSYKENIRAGKMVSTLPRAVAHEKGAYIKPVNKKMLHWMDGSTKIFAKAVRIKPKRYVASTIGQEKKQVVQIFAQTFRQMLERV